MADLASDQVLDALAAVLEVFEMTGCQAQLVEKRSQELRTGRSEGGSYAELVTSASSPLVIDVVSELLGSLLDAGSRLRRAEARALYAEGLSMDKIARLLRVSRQRVSAIINSPLGDADDGPAQYPSRSGGYP
jgi:hypothetical protein